MKGTIQAVLVPRKWKREAVEKFLERNDMKSELEEEGEYWIAVQRPRDAFKSVRVVRRARGVVFRLGYSEAQPAPEAGRAWWDNPNIFGDLFK